MLLPVLFSALVPTAASAQWIVDAALGRAVYDPTSTQVGATNASLGIRYRGPVRGLPSPENWAYLSGGTDLSSQGLIWGAAGMGGRLGLLRRGSWDLGVELGGHAYAFSESNYELEVAGRPVTLVEAGDYGATVQAIPSLMLRSDRVALELRSGVVTTMGPYEDEFLTGGNGEFIAVTAFDGGANVTATLAPGVQVGGVGRYMHFPEGGYPYLGGSVQFSRGPGALWLTGGHWLSDELESPRSAFGVGASVTPLPGFEVSATWQQEPSDPIYLNGPRRTWSMRVSRTIGRPRAAQTLTEVAPPVPADGTTVIRLSVSGLDAPPSVLGDFTEWKPVPMVRNGLFWEVRLPVPPGIHHYGFRNSRGEFFIPPHLASADDGMGGKSAILVVP